MSVPKKALVIGGSGFMGSHTADELSRRGFSVTIYDQSPSPWLRDDQEIIVANLMDTDILQNAVKKSDYVFHFAGIADIGEASKRPRDTIESNIMGTTLILEAIVRHPVERFIYASTMYVYSDYGSFYRASKQSTEVIIDAYREKFGVEYTLLRYGSLYGPRSQDWNGVRSFVSQIVNNGVLDYGGNGKEIREYIHVFDAAKLSVDILDKKHVNCAITITGQQSMKVNDLFSILFEITGKTENIVYHNKFNTSNHYGNTPYRYTPKKAKKLVPQEFVDLGQGLLDLVEEVCQDL